MNHSFKKRFLTIICLSLALIMCFAGCKNAAQNQGEDSGSNPEAESEKSTFEKNVDIPDVIPTPAPSKPDLDFGSNPTMQGIDTSFSKNYADMFTARDLSAEYDVSKSALVSFQGDKVDTSSKAVYVSGTTVRLEDEGTYVFSGTLTDGMIFVEASKDAKIQIVLNGVDLTSKTGAAIYVKQANKVFITLAPGTENKLINGGSFVQVDDNMVDSVIFSKQDLTLNGSGTLIVGTTAGHGIVSKDDLVIAGGAYVINTAMHGIDANDSVRLANAFVNIQSGKDGIRAKNDEDAALGFVYINDGEYQIKASGDAISATSSVQIDCGSFDLNSGFGIDAANDDTTTSKKGIKTAHSLLVVDGTFNAEAFEDFVNAKGSIILAKGTFTLKSGDDAFHADKSLYAVDATVTISECREGLEGYNVDIRGGKITINSSDDAINVAGGKDTSDGEEDPFFSEVGTLNISGGEIIINALGDGIDVKGEFLMSDGLLRISVSAKDGNSAYDYESGGNITGGVFIATGSKKVSQIPTSSTQGFLSVASKEDGAVFEAGTEITVSDADGKLVFSETPTYDFEMFIATSSGIKAGAEYTITIGSSSIPKKAN